jgi:hypothetical protein
LRNKYSSAACGGGGECAGKICFTKRNKKYIVNNKDANTLKKWLVPFSACTGVTAGESCG